MTYIVSRGALNSTNSGALCSNTV